MFPYFGSKWKMAKKYPAPTYRKLIEPFAGSACYSLHYHWHKVILVDLNPIVCGVWDFLTNCSNKDIESLPLMFDHIDEVNTCQEAKWLIGFWLKPAKSSPAKSFPPSTLKALSGNYASRPGKSSLASHHCSFWNANVKQRIIKQKPAISHWKIYNRSYQDIKCNDKATWFIDPPYQSKAGKMYTFNNKGVDFDELGLSILGWPGQKIVCEMDGANWLPFKSLTNQARYGFNGSVDKYKELVFIDQS